MAVQGGDAQNGGDGSGEKCSGGSSGPRSPGEGIEDPEVIIARRNADHRRMQARQHRGKESAKNINI